ncbi:AzlC family ABC transporter permease [Aliagarivorans taiwanensis]|uniref:AzlC family ABC transporter permease n=1 Tax=Aliagarivorans taiwanensis TaxID=561966 RepID=UPI00047DF802|nr:AzlC family ABC transporter permease [Aliagarivorans taiwanensis]
MDLDSQNDLGASHWRELLKGALAVTPLSIAVLPWGLLAGSFALESGLDVFQSQAMSAIVFAGSTQLVACGLFKAGASLSTMLLTTLFVTSRHLLYSLAMRPHISKQPLRWRLLLGFLLTDELFALCGKQKPEQFDRWYALGAGLWFYLCWNAASLVGIVAGAQLPNLQELGLDFAVAATFIALVIPQVKSLPVLAAVLIAGVASLVFELIELSGGLIFASLLAMVSAYLLEKAQQAGRGR